jgi:hypothetical protein
LGKSEKERKEGQHKHFPADAAPPQKKRDPNSAKKNGAEEIAVVKRDDRT